MEWLNENDEPYLVIFGSRARRAENVSRKANIRCQAKRAIPLIEHTDRRLTSLPHYSADTVRKGTSQRGPPSVHADGMYSLEKSKGLYPKWEVWDHYTLSRSIP